MLRGLFTGAKWLGESANGGVWFQQLQCHNMGYNLLYSTENKKKSKGGRVHVDVKLNYDGLRYLSQGEAAIRPGTFPTADSVSITVSREGGQTPLWKCLLKEVTFVHVEIASVESIKNTGIATCKRN